MDDLSFIRKYKNAIFVLVFTIATPIVLWQVILPQLEAIKENRKKIEIAEKKVETLNNTIKVLAAVDDSELDEYYELTTTALPQVKNILLIYNELVAATQRGEVELGSLAINLGGVYSREKKKEEFGDLAIGSPSIDFAVNISGESKNIRNFSQELYKSIPILEIGELSIRSDQGGLDARFFFNPLSNTSVDSETPAKLFSDEELKDLENLKTWDDSSKSKDQLDLESPSTNENSSDSTTTPSVSSGTSSTSSPIPTP